MDNSIFNTNKAFLVDSNIWIAKFSDRDAYHQKAKILVENLPQNATLLITNLVIYEVLTILSMRVGKDRAIQFNRWLASMLSEGSVDEIFIDELLERKTLSLFCGIKNKNLSFADCATAIVAREYGVKSILTFDRHFKVFEKDFGLNIWKHSIK